MATLRTIASPPELVQAPTKVLSIDGRTVACRVEGPKAGLWAFDVGGVGRPLKTDEDGRRYHSPSWSAWGDLLFHVDSPKGPMVGVVPAFGRGSAAEYPGTGIAVSADGRVLAVADSLAGALKVSAVAPGNSPFHEAPKTIGEFKEAVPSAPMALDVTRDGAFVVVVRHAQERAPSLWSFPSAGGDPQGSCRRWRRPRPWLSAWARPSWRSSRSAWGRRRPRGSSCGRWRRGRWA
ncbi:MAG: hypothetical protein QM765_08720 [Myxococcales bacterium]